MERFDGNVLEINFGLSVIPPADVTEERYIELMSSDKKVEEGKIRFVLLKAIGNAVIEDQIDDQILRKTLTGGEKLCL